MSARPRVVFAMPAYNRPDSLPQTLESILAQSYREFALLIQDDSTSDANALALEPYLSLDARIVYERNTERLGMIANWRKCFTRARSLYPESEYFAWVSDHDSWHPRWLEVLVEELDRSPEIVLAYPTALRTFKDSPPEVNRSFDTSGLTNPADRLRLCARQMVAGNMIYGLFRADALAQAGVFRALIMPDRQVLLELSLLGQFKQVPQLLWYREINSAFSHERQRAALFPKGTPLYCYLPIHLTHFATLVWDLTVWGRGRPAVNRRVGLQCAALQLYWSTRRELGAARRALQELRTSDVNE